MKKQIKLSRPVIVMLAIAIGLFLVFGISKISNTTKGPIESVLENAGSAVQGVEKSLILSQRGESRVKKLAWFEPFKLDKNRLINSKIVLFGASDNSSYESYENIINLEDSLALSFPIIHIYKAWGENKEHEFPKKELSAINEIGSVAMITWEPWVSAFSVENYPGIPEPEFREKGGLAYITNGYYDKYIREWAVEAKAFSKPIYIRLGHEMNDPYRYPWGPHNNSPKDFIAAWQHVHDVFKMVGANNIIWVWSPHLSYGFLHEFYPGDQYVDVIASGVLNFGTSVTWSKWWSFKELFGNSYEAIAAFNKPIMIAEFGSLGIGGNRANWFSAALKGIHQDYPLVNSVVFFHYSGDNTITDKYVNWYFVDDLDVTAAIKNSLANWPAEIKQP